MKLTLTRKVRFLNHTPCGEQGSVRPVVLALVSFLLGVGVAAFWFHRPAGGNAENSVSQTAAQPAPSPTVPPPVTASPVAPSPAPSTPSAPARPQPIDPAVIEEVKKLVPNYASISLEDGENILRAATLDQMDAQIKAAPQQLQDSQNGQSTAEQLEKFKDMAARLQAQIAALKTLKSQP